MACSYFAVASSCDWLELVGEGADRHPANRMPLQSIAIIAIAGGILDVLLLLRRAYSDCNRYWLGLQWRAFFGPSF
jgi:hypothetical protein